MRSDFEKNRYWIGLYRSDVDFDETLGEFGRYVANGSRKFDAANLESFNEKWEVYANAWQHQQSKVDELQKKNTKLVHALIMANEKSSHWAGEYWKGVERSAEYQAILLTSDNDLEVNCFKKEKEIERLRKQVYELEQALKGGEP